MEIKNNIFSVGIVDADVRIFHGYKTPYGTTYNSFLVIDEKITLIDFVKATFADEFLENLKSVLGGRKIDYIICNHVEPDHSGALPEVVKAYPEAVIYGTANCCKELKVYYPDSTFEFETVKSGDSLNTGKYNFSFIPMPMVHWPDSMSTYLSEEKILFSNDALGQHIGTGVVFDTDLGLEPLLERAGDYYANIVLPFGMQVGKLLDGLSQFKIEMICPSHGVILTAFIPQMITKYIDWSKNVTDDKKVVIVFDTMWGTTRKLATAICEEYKDFDVELIDLSKSHYSYAMSRVLEAKFIFVGSPTLNNNMLPTVSAFLTYMKGLKPKNRVGLSFGSYGWSGESIKQIHDILRDCGFEMKEPLKAVWNI